MKTAILLLASSLVASAQTNVALQNLPRGTNFGADDLIIVSALVSGTNYQARGVPAIFLPLSGVTNTGNLQPASVNLTNWSGLPTNVLVLSPSNYLVGISNYAVGVSNSAYVASNDLRATTQPATDNLTNWSLTPISALQAPVASSLELSDFKDFTQRTNEYPWDPGPDGFSVATGTGANYWATNYLEIRDGALRTRIAPNNIWATNIAMPALYVSKTFIPAARKFECRVRWTTNDYDSSTVNYQQARNLNISMQKPKMWLMETNGTDYGKVFDIEGMTIHVNFGYNYGQFIVQADVWTNGINSTYTGESYRATNIHYTIPLESQEATRSVGPIVTFPYAGVEEVVGMEFVNDNTLRIYKGNYAFLWTLDIFTNLVNSSSNSCWFEYIGGGTNHVYTSELMYMAASTKTSYQLPKGVEERINYDSSFRKTLFVGDAVGMTNLSANWPGIDQTVNSLVATNLAVNMRGAAYQFIIATNNLYLSNITNGPGAVTLCVRPNGGERTITWPTNYMTLNTNGLTQIGNFWTLTLSDTYRATVINVINDGGTNHSNNIIWGANTW